MSRNQSVRKLPEVQGRTWLHVPIFFLFLAISGCGQRVIPISSLDAADSALKNALEAWKSGATVDDQRSQSPPVYVSDELWQDGSRLLRYHVATDGERYGPNVRIKVELECTKRNGRARKQIVSYLISTTPAITIARQD